MTAIRTARLSPQLLEVRIPYTSHHDRSEFLLVSDVHLDNPKCDRKLFAKHLDQAVERNAQILVFGDLLCLMQGKKDRRGSKGDIRPEHLGGNYFDLVFRESADWLKPWQDRIIMMGDGNHETAIINHQEIDPLENLSRLMRDSGSPVEHMGYQGFVRFMFEQKEKSRIRKLTLYFHHGAWGGIITKGTLGGGRYASIAPDADVLVNGHNHERSMVSHPCYRVAQNGQVWTEQRWHVQTGTYKHEFKDPGGWAVERIVMPKSLGGLWMTLTPRNVGGVEISFSPAT